MMTDRSQQIAELDKEIVRLTNELEGALPTECLSGGSLQAILKLREEHPLTAEIHRIEAKINELRESTEAA